MLLPSPFDAVESRTTVNLTRPRNWFHAASADSADAPQLVDPSIRPPDDPNWRFIVIVPSGHMSLNSTNADTPPAAAAAKINASSARLIAAPARGPWRRPRRGNRRA